MMRVAGCSGPLVDVMPVPVHVPLACAAPWCRNGRNRFLTSQCIPESSCRASGGLQGPQAYFMWGPGHIKYKGDKGDTWARPPPLRAGVPHPHFMDYTKLAKRYGRSLTSKCPLCKQEDGGFHLASGCPKLTNAYTDRHHAAGTLILNAVRAGSAGTTVIQADVGSQDKQIKMGLPPLPHDIPSKYLTNTAKKHKTQQNMGGSSSSQPGGHPPLSRPDFTLHTEHKTQGGPTTHKFTLVEVKYCVDTKPQDQLEKAQAQHEPLLQHLRQTPNTIAELRIILLGAAGYIYNSETKEQLESLGIQGTAMKSLLTNLHVQRTEEAQTQSPEWQQPQAQCSLGCIFQAQEAT